MPARCWGYLTLLLMLILFSVILTSRAKSEPVYVENCSGVYLGHGYVLTAGHCVEQSDLFVSKANPERKDNESVEKYTALPVFVTPGRDYGLLRLDKALVKTTKQERDDDDKGKFKEAPLGTIPFQPTKVSCEPLKLGEPLTFKGWPAGEYVETTGVVASPVGEHFMWRVSALVQGAGFFGSSGSGALNAQGQVKGILVGTLQGSGLYVILPTNDVCNILPREIQ